MQVSVIIPVYNHASFLREAVNSALKQPETSEVILVDDGSKDNSLKICKELEKKFEKVRVFTHEKNENLGVSESRNVGIYKAQFDFIAFLDADDYFLENRFKQASKILSENPNVDGVYEAIEARFETEDDENRWKSSGNDLITSVRKSVKPEELFVNLFFGTYGHFSCDGLTVRKNLFDKCGMFESSLRISQDTHMWFKMVIVGKLVGGSLKKPVAVRRVHQHNRIRAASEKEMIKYRAILWKSLGEWIETIGANRKTLAKIRFKKYHYDRIIKKEKFVNLS